MKCAGPTLPLARPLSLCTVILSQLLIFSLELMLLIDVSCTRRSLVAVTDPIHLRAQIRILVC